MTEATRAAAFSRLRVGRARLQVAAGVATEWVQELVPWAAALAMKGTQGVVSHQAPPGRAGEVMVKLYRFRQKDHLWRRLRTSRAVKEGAGYLAFQQRGLLVPELLVSGESRRWGLFELGLVVTTRVPAISVADEFASRGEPDLLFATARELSTIHLAGLAHGDPYTRNFLATRPRPMPLDIASWSRFGRASQLQDLTRFTCSILKLTGDPMRASALLQHYASAGLPLPISADALLDRARAYAEGRRIRA